MEGLFCTATALSVTYYRLSLRKPCRSPALAFDEIEGVRGRTGADCACLSAGGVPGSVWLGDDFGEAGPAVSSVCVAEDLVVGSQSLSNCVDWSTPGCVACVPRWTRANGAVCVALVEGRVGESGSGESSGGTTQASLGLV